jgi:hypothetical protein
MAEATQEQPVMMTEEEKKDVSRWHDRIKTAAKRRERVGLDYGWERIIKEYKGKYNLTLGSGDPSTRIDVPPINQVFSYVQSDIAGMNFRDPYLAVNPKKTSSVKSAKIIEAKINYDWREMKLKQEVDSEMIDADLVGHGWHKDGYNMDLEGSDDQLKITKEGMYSMFVSWRDVVFNVGARRPPKDCLWMAHRIIRPRDLAVEKFPSLQKLQGSDHPHLSKDECATSDYKDDIKVVVFWEVWDGMKREKFLLAEGFEGYVKPPTPWPEYYEEFPFSMLWYYETPDEPYPMSPIYPWEAQILEVNKLFAQMLNHAKRWNRQVFYKGTAINEKEMDKYEQGVDGAMIKVDGQGPLNEALRFADYGNLPQDFYMILDRLAQVERETNGQPEFERGGVTKTNTRTWANFSPLPRGPRAVRTAGLTVLKPTWKPSPGT